MATAAKNRTKKKSARRVRRPARTTPRISQLEARVLPDPKHVKGGDSGEYEFPETQTFDFADLRDLDAFSSYGTTNARQAALMTGLSPRKYAQSGVYTTHFGSTHLLYDANGWYGVDANIVYPLNGLPSIYGVDSSRSLFERVAKLDAGVREGLAGCPLAVVLPYSVPRPDKGSFELSLAVNADFYEHEIHGNKSIPVGPKHQFADDEFLGDSAMPMFSFRCLGRFFDVPPRAVAKLLASGDLRVVAFTPSTTLDLTDDHKEQLKAWNRSRAESKPSRPPIKPIRPGYSLIDFHTVGAAKWHNPGAALIRDTRKGGRSILLGTDDDAYFGCELTGGHPSSVDAAYLSLQPKEVRESKTVWQRQGEWFVVPVDEKEVPAATDCSATFDSLILPKDDDAAADHEIRTDGPTFSEKRGRISKDGVVYARDFCLTHSNEDHPELNVSGWARFYRNTAGRSFSVKGVD